jgi:hypothetical protein
MKTLIRKFLNEFLLREEFNVFFSGQITETKYKKFILESGSRITRNKDMQNEIQNHADKLGPILGKFRDKRNNQEKSAFIKIKVGLHFAERVFRSEDKSDNRFKKVDKFEGVDVIVANADKIVQLLMTQNVTRNGVIKLKSKFRDLNYEILCSLEERISGNPPTYKIELFNQIKGTGNVQFGSEPFDHELKVMNPYF